SPKLTSGQSLVHFWAKNGPLGDQPQGVQVAKRRRGTWTPGPPGTQAGPRETRQRPHRRHEPTERCLVTEAFVNSLPAIPPNGGGLDRLWSPTAALTTPAPRRASPSTPAPK